MDCERKARSPDSRRVSATAGISHSAGLEQVQAVAFAHLPLQKLFQPGQAHLRVGMGDTHRILRGIAVAKPRAPAHLDKGGKAGERDVYLTLVQVPLVQA